MAYPKTGDKDYDTAMEKRAVAYREFRQWAIREIADSIIREGFREIGGVLDRILQHYRTLEKEHPIVPREIDTANR